MAVRTHFKIPSKFMDSLSHSGEPHAQVETFSINLLKDVFGYSSAVVPNFDGDLFRIGFHLDLG